jgi:hypothetical protein
MMKKISLKNLSRKSKVYAAVLLACFVSVFVRIGLVQMDRGRQIVSFTAEWSKNGKPVTAQEIQARDVPAYTKLTARALEGKRSTGFVTGDIKDKLQAGQEVFCADRSKPCGMIASIGSELDTNTGMFPVEIELNAAHGSGDPAVFFVHTGTLTNALVVPNEILDFSGDEYYLWKVEDAKAKRIQVKTGSRNGYGTVISGGINPGDLIVFNGRSTLVDGDKVRITEGAL